MKILLIMFLGFVHTFYHSKMTLLERIQAEGKLVVVTRASPTTYQRAENGQEDGLEYELAARFARELGVHMELILAENSDQVLHLTASKRAHLAAAGLAVTPERRNYVRFGPSYQTVRAELVYRNGSRQPQGPEDLVHTGTCLFVEANPDYLLPLQQLRAQNPGLVWGESQLSASRELLQQVDEQTIDYTVVYSNELAYYQRRWPNLRAAFDLTDDLPLAWMFPRLSDDDSLYLAALRFFNQLRASGELARLLDRYYGHMEDFDYVHTKTFHEHIEQRLPKLRPLFVKAATELGLDWRLLAAIAYQESRWDAHAVSPTGVRGVMQLTEETAKRMGVQDRADSAQSIDGGSRYFHMILTDVPLEIPEPDRTWLALAAYNQGQGHVEDARTLTARYGADPNHWVDVQAYLRKLSQPGWHSQTRHGYSRGFEAVHFVMRVREFYDTLQQVFPRESAVGGNTAAATANKKPAAAKIPR